MRLETCSDLPVNALEFLQVKLHVLDLVEITFLNLVQKRRELFLELIYRSIQFINRLFVVIFCRSRVLLCLGAPIPEILQHLLLELQVFKLFGDTRINDLVTGSSPSGGRPILIDLEFLLQSFDPRLDLAVRVLRVDVLLFGPEHVGPLYMHFVPHFLRLGDRLSAGFVVVVAEELEPIDEVVLQLCRFGC